MSETVFVYGSLKRGGSNHHYLHNADCLGPASTVEAYALYLGDWPYLIRDEARQSIRGEVYRIDTATLARLDELEGHPHEYCREKTAIRLDNGQVLEAWVYFYPQAQGRLLTDGEYLIESIR
jgi:gamma-glutamylcyclotransferase (GGCT)/AIG2-like uncharacterized protein YtfP